MRIFLWFSAIQAALGIVVDLVAMCEPETDNPARAGSVLAGIVILAWAVTLLFS